MHRLLSIAVVVNSFFLAGFAFAAEPEQPEGTKWWKGNIHTHSLWSDGNDFPEMIADWYRSHGYHFLALTDHNVLSRGDRWMSHDEVIKRAGQSGLDRYVRRFGDDWVETRGEPGSPGHEVRLKPLDEFRKLVEEPGRFLMIEAEEISDKAEGVPIHLNATNIQELLDPAGGRTVAETIDNNLRAVEEQARRTGKEILVHLNHPNFGLAVTAEDMATILRERFFEVYNGHPGVKHLGDKDHPSVEELWDIANTIRLGKLKYPPLFGVATDDSHNYHSTEGATSGRGWIMVRAADLEPETLIKAIKAGDCYASSGVTLEEVQFDPKTKTLSLTIEPNGDEEFTTEFIGTRIDYDPTSEPRVDAKGKPIRSSRKYSADVGKVLATAKGLTPSYQLKGDELYVRAVVNSTAAPDNPVYENQKKQAWSQPVGWEERLAGDGDAAGN
jgi:hypothetical protein